MCEVPIPHRISSSNSFSPYFDGCIGALDGTHIPVHVSEARHAVFWNWKGEISQNVLAVCTMDMRFMFVLLGWEGSASDTCIFEDTRRKGFTILEDCYYLANVGYANSDALLDEVPWAQQQHPRHQSRDPDKGKGMAMSGIEPKTPGMDLQCSTTELPGLKSARWFIVDIMPK